MNIFNDYKAIEEIINLYFYIDYKDNRNINTTRLFDLTNNRYNNIFKITSILVDEVKESKLNKIKNLINNII